jgi:DNA-binding transcriptional ArsR family regulator
MDQQAVDVLVGRVAQMLDTSAVMAAAEIGVADRLADGPRSVTELAEALGADETALGRLLDILTGSGVVRSTGDGRYALEPLGEPLRTDVPDSLRGFLRGAALWAGTGAVAGSVAVRSGGPSFESVFGLPFWPYLQKNPEIGSVFNSAMVSFGGAMGTPCIDVYDFSGIDHLVDVGGGIGQLAREVARRNPSLRATILDQPHNIAEAETAIAADGLQDRCRAVAGDFFVSVPGGDCYTLRWIIHDWTDEESITILRACRESIAPGGRILLFEVVRPDADGPHLARTLDWVMLNVIQGQERTEKQYQALLKAAGFQLERVVPSATPMSIIEAFPI